MRVLICGYLSQFESNCRRNATKSRYFGCYDESTRNHPVRMATCGPEDASSSCICTHATGSRPPEHEPCAQDAAAACSVETTRLRPNVVKGLRVSPDPTRQKTRHPKWNCSEHFNRRQPTRNVRRTDATKSHCCRTAKSAPIGRPLTPWKRQQLTPLAHDKQHF